jgi:hypothetical protein
MRVGTWGEKLALSLQNSLQVSPRQGLREGEGRGQRLEDLRGEREAGNGVVTRAAPVGIRGAH